MITALYTDGGVMGPNPSLIGGMWAWCHVDERGEHIEHASGIVRPFVKDAACNLLPVTNNNTEMIALTRGLLSLPEGWEGTVYSDSRLALGWTFWNFKHELVPACLYAKMLQAKERLGWIRPVLLDGHPTAAHLLMGKGKRGQPVSIHNKWCDEECGRIGRECREGLNK